MTCSGAIAQLLKKLASSEPSGDNRYMDTVSIEVPRSVVGIFGPGDEDMSTPILTAAVVKWYELGKISQSRAAEILEISRSRFLSIMSEYRVSPWQYTADELDGELALD
jgi:hypothetical protein